MPVLNLYFVSTYILTCALYFFVLIIIIIMIGEGIFADVPVTSFLVYAKKKFEFKT